MRATFVAVAGSLLLWSPDLALGQLSAQDCAALASVYGAVAPGCAQGATTVTASKKTAVTQAVAKGGLPAPRREDLPLAVLTSNVFFESGGTELGPAARRQLEALGRLLRAQTFTGTCLHLTGHTDSTGTAQDNQRVATLRAERVAKFLATLPEAFDHVVMAPPAGDAIPLPMLAATDPRQRRVSMKVGSCPESIPRRGTGAP